MRNWIVIVGLVVSSLGLASLGEPGQEAPKSSDACTVEMWDTGAGQPGDKCELSRLRVQTKQQAAQIAFNAYQRALQDLSAAAEAEKKANHWPEDTQYNMNGGIFIAPQPAPEKKPQATPEKK